MKRKEIGPYLKGLGFRSDPVKAWKASLASQQEEEEKEPGSDQEEGQEVGVEGQDYDYLMSMPGWSFTRDEKERILKKRDDKVL